MRTEVVQSNAEPHPMETGGSRPRKPPLQRFGQARFHLCTLLLSELRYPPVYGLLMGGEVRH